MIEFLHKLFSSDFMAHGYCYLWKPEIVWLHAASDGLIAIAYYVIPMALIYFVRRRRDVPFHWMFFMFGIFIFGCGTTHAMEVWTLWHGTYWVAGVIKAITAGASLATAAALVPLVPRALLLPGPGQLRAANLELERENSERRRMEEALQKAHDELELRVQQRTAELAQANERLQTEVAERRRAEEHFRWTVEAAPNAIVMVNQDGKIVLVNSQTERLFGYGREELLGKNIETLVPESLRNSHPGLRRKFLDDPHARPMGVGLDLHAQRKDGSQFPVEIGLNPIETAKGTWVLSSIVDITFDKQKLESIGVLASGIAHDFNNLLGSILADTELALADLPAASPSVEEIQRIRAVAIRAAEIVRELMIYAGQEKADLKPIDVTRLAEEMLELLKVSISKHAVLKTSFGENLPAVLGNAAQIRQVVMNLIINASEAIGEKDGIITVATSRATESQDLASLAATDKPKGDYLRLAVSDTGCGMTEEVQAKIFDPYFTTKFVGRGRGLAVVQGIVRAHGGAINVVSGPNQGTTFQILLPCADKPAKQDRSAIVPTPSERDPSTVGTVLLVEDEDSLRVPVARMLRKNGFSVVEAIDGSAAVELFHAHQAHIDVILLDMTIPGASSRDVVAEVLRIRPDIRVILMSAYSREEVTSSLDAPQVTRFIRKPFHLGDLVSLLQDTLSSQAISQHLN